MEEKNKQLKSIFGSWWEAVRKWFYPTWLLYELSIRFYDYAIAVYNYFIKQQDYLASYIGEIGALISAVFSSVATFIICTAFLTVPACFLLYRFFKTENLSATPFEDTIKKYF
mgnify:CR=1 FL=1|tara:strand:- start:4715 stop:5053 length:339 start_codon:yes stop_codon:yes gene_type:complete